MLRIMNRNKHKILVLSDLKENAKETLEYAIHIAKEINGAIELLCIKKPTEVVATENPLAAKRDINNEFVKAQQNAKDLVKNATKDEFFPVKNTVKFGNVKSEIEDYVHHYNPDFIVLGKKQKRFLQLREDNITDFVTKKYQQKVCIPQKTSIAEIYERLNAKIDKEQTA